MNPNNDLKGLCASVIGLIAGGLTYIGTFAYQGTEHCSIWVVMVAIPAFITALICHPDTSTSYILAAVGSFLFYCVIGTVILLIVQRWIKRRSEKRNKDGDGGNRI